MAAAKSLPRRARRLTERERVRRLLITVERVQSLFKSRMLRIWQDLQKLRWDAALETYEPGITCVEDIRHHISATNMAFGRRG